MPQDGRFQEAVKTAEGGPGGVDPKEQPGFIENLQRELKLYEAGSPFMDTP